MSNLSLIGSFYTNRCCQGVRVNYISSDTRITSVNVGNCLSTLEVSPKGGGEFKDQSTGETIVFSDLAARVKRAVDRLNRGSICGWYAFYQSDRLVAFLSLDRGTHPGEFVGKIYKVADKVKG